MMRTALSVAALAAVCSVASADVYSWSWQAGDTGVSNNGGVMEQIDMSFNTHSNQLNFDVTFSDQVSDGYTLAVSPGANPKGHAGELALLYFDASDMGDVRVNAFAYNGQNNQTSYYDGSPDSGTQAPDKLVSSLNAIDAATMTASASDNNGKRTFSLSLDASVINGHTPANPGPNGPSEWTGVAFESLMGIWFHPFKDLQTSYGQDGYLTDWSGRQGWLDGSGFQTTVPAPATGASLLALAFAGRRRRGC
jgi:hypothetical protein